MPHLAKLPEDIEDVEAFLRRRDAAKETKGKWRSLYSECYRYAMPSRDTFSETSEGTEKAAVLYDSTLQESTYTAANTICALLFPAWTRWVEFAVGGAIKSSDVPPELNAQLRDATERFFMFLNQSNFTSVINEVALDLMVGTGAMAFNEGTDEQPFNFSSVPLSVIEIEEGPTGKVETTFMPRKPEVRNLVRMYQGLRIGDLSASTQELLKTKPEEKVEILHSTVFDTASRSYYGVVTELETKKHVWRFNYGESNPMIVARATKLAGETFGRGRVMLALSDARTLDRMQEFVLRHSAVSIAPPATAVSDGVLNPYTAILAPNTILPVASNDNSNPSLRVLEVGGNFAIGETIITSLRERIRRTLIGPEPSEGAVRSATEISINDRNRLWSMNGELSRIQSELLDKIVVRGVHILQRRGLLPKFRLDGQEVAVRYHSPFSKSQDSEDILALTRTLEVAQLAGAGLTEMDLKVEIMPSWVARKAGLDELLVRSRTEKAQFKEAVERATQLALQQMQESGQIPGLAAA